MIYSGMERDLRMGFLGSIVSIGVARLYSPMFRRDGSGWDKMSVQLFCGMILLDEFGNAGYHILECRAICVHGGSLGMRFLQEP